MFLLLSTTLCGANITTKDTLVISSTQTTHRAGNYLHTLEDKKGLTSFLDISNNPLFVRSTSAIPNFGVTSSCYWVKLIVKNETNSTEDFMLEFEKITADNLTLYYKVNDGTSDYTIINANNRQKKYLSRLFLFDLNIPTNKSATIFIKYKTNWATTFPILISSRVKMLQDIFNEELIKGIYIGILFIMVFYNLFIYFSIKDRSYLYYVIYISFFLALQLNDLGYTHKYLFYNYPIFYDLGIKILPSLTSISAILFVRNFLNTKLHCSKLDKGLNILVIAFTLILGFSFNNQDNELYFTLINILTLTIALYLLLIGAVLSYKGTFLAKYFLVAWSILLLSIIQFNLSNLGLIPYYEITDHSLEIGSLIEVFLLSLALAHRINTLKKEKENSQEETIQLIQEKKNIIKNQNTILENLVYERTKELEQQNKIISDKDAEKSIMMREIHHRVKNNLQMINSMVRLQTRYHDKENTINSLKEVERRILTMAVLHEKMYQSDNLISVNIKDFITTVIIDLLNIYKNEKKFKYKVDAPEINFKSESILYIGLLISELITNSLKHGFHTLEDGYLYINLHQNGHNDYIINVSNNGDKIDIDKFNTSESLGQRLIHNFVKQLNGDLSIQCNDDITTFSVRFKEEI